MSYTNDHCITADNECEYCVDLVLSINVFAYSESDALEEAKSTLSTQFVVLDEKASLA